MNDTVARAPESNLPDDSLQALLRDLLGARRAGPPLDDRELSSKRLRGLALLALAGLTLYGATAGLFAGGAQIVVAAWKAPLIALFSLLLCLPSLVVATGLGGADWTARRLLAAALAHLAGLSTILAALVPVVFLFSVSSRYLAWIVLLHLLIWWVAVGYAGRSLRAFTAPGSRFARVAWSALFLFVSLQAATLLLEHFGRILEIGHAAS